MQHTPIFGPVAMIAVFLAIVPVLTSSAWGQDMNEDLKLLADDGADNDEFGTASAVGGGHIAIGSPKDRDNGPGSGSVYLFDANTGVQVAKLLPNDGDANDEFGYSIAIDDGIIAVGARSDDDNGNLAGSAYLFDMTTGIQLFKLLPADGAVNDYFGWSIAIDNGIVVVGASHADVYGNQSGVAYLFDASTGEQTARLLPDDGAAIDYFGWSVAIDNGVVAVGAVSDDDNGNNSGSVYYFDVATGEQTDKITPNDGAMTNFFGWSLAMHNGVVAVGAPGAGDNGAFSGSAYLFDAVTGVELAKLLPSDGTAGDQFGNAVSLDSCFAVVGSFLDSNGSGSAYLFDVSNGTQVAKLSPSDSVAGATFGRSTAICEGIVTVGAPEISSQGTGSAYVYDICSAEITGDCIVNTQDLLAFFNLWGDEDPIADWNGDGEINTQDLLAYQNAWTAGCP